MRSPSVHFVRIECSAGDILALSKLDGWCGPLPTLVSLLCAAPLTQRSEPKSKNEKKSGLCRLASTQASCENKVSLGAPRRRCREQAGSHVRIGSTHGPIPSRKIKKKRGASACYKVWQPPPQKKWLHKCVCNTHRPLSPLRGTALAMACADAGRVSGGDPERTR